MSPRIGCLILTRDMDHFLQRSLKSFMSQRRFNKQLEIYTHLIVMDTGAKKTMHITTERPFLDYWHRPDHYGSTIGAIRNMALEGAPADLDYIAHFDVDDWSAPDRLERQLAHIEKTGKLVTGFNDMLFMDTVKDRTAYYTNPDKRYSLGTALFYKFEAWKQHKFPDQTPEDNIWRSRVGLDNCESVSSLREDGTPMMIQTVHGGNASAAITTGSYWKETDTHQDRMIREIMANA